MVLGVLGKPGVTDLQSVDDVIPQTLVTLTQMLPAVNVGPNAALMLLVLEVPDTPVGKVHAYDAAPADAFTA
jgi:hypothetical protein